MKRRGIRTLLSFILIAVYLGVTAFFASDTFDVISLANKTFQAEYLHNAEVTNITYTYKYIETSSAITSDQIPLYDKYSGNYNTNNNDHNGFTVDKDQELKFTITVEGKNAKSAKYCVYNCSQNKGDNYASEYAFMFEGETTTIKQWNVKLDTVKSTSTKAYYEVSLVKRTGNNVDKYSDSYVLSANYGESTNKFNFNISKYYYSTLTDVSLSTNRINVANVQTPVTFSANLRFITKLTSSGWSGEQIIKDHLNVNFNSDIFIVDEVNKYDDIKRDRSNLLYTIYIHFKNNIDPNLGNIAYPGDYQINVGMKANGDNQRYNMQNVVTKNISIGDFSFDVNSSSNDSRKYTRINNAAKTYAYVKKYNDNVIEVCADDKNNCETIRRPEGNDFTNWNSYLVSTDSINTSVQTIKSKGFDFNYSNNGQMVYRSGNAYLFRGPYNGNNEIQYATTNNYYSGNIKTVKVYDCDDLKNKEDYFFYEDNNWWNYDELREYPVEAKYACIAYDEVRESDAEFADDGYMTYPVETSIATRSYGDETSIISLDDGTPGKLVLKQDAGNYELAQRMVDAIRRSDGWCPPENVSSQNCDNRYTVAKHYVDQGDVYLDKSSNIFPRILVSNVYDGSKFDVELYYRENEKTVMANPSDAGTYVITFYIRKNWWENVTFYNIYVNILNSKLYYYTYTNSSADNGALNDLVTQHIKSNAGSEYRTVGCKLSSSATSMYCTNSNLIKVDGRTLYNDELEEYINNNPESGYVYITNFIDYKTNIFLKDTLDSYLMNLSLKGYPGNVDYSQSLGIYAIDEDSKKIERLSNYNVSAQIYTHNVGKNGDGTYNFFDTTRYKLKITGYNPVQDEETNILDEEESTISYKLYQYPVNSSVYEGDEPDEVTSSVKAFRTAMNTVGLNVAEAFTEPTTASLSHDLISHIKLDGERVYLVYGSGKEIVAYSPGNNYATTNGDTLKVPTFIEYADGSRVEPKASSVTAVNDDFFYFIKTAEFNTDVVDLSYTDGTKTANFQGQKPEPNSYIFEVNKVVNSRLTTAELAEEDVSGKLFDITLNPICTAENLNTYSKVGKTTVVKDGVVYIRDCSEVTAGNPDLSCKTYPYNGSVADAKTETYYEMLGYCSAESHVISPKTNVPKGAYFVFVDYNSADILGYTTDADKFSKKLYPELYGNNSHMTRLTYSDPIYVMTYGDVKYGSTSIPGNLDNAYENIINQISVPITFNYNYDEDLSDHVKYVIQKQDGSGNWVDDSNNYGFDIDAILYPTIKRVNNESMITLSNMTVDSNGETNMVEIASGNYRIGVTYGTYSGNTFTPLSNTYYKEFLVRGRYYNLRMEDKLNFAYYHNVADEIGAYNNDEATDVGVILNTVSISDRDNITVQINNVNDASQVFVVKKTNNKRNGHTVFDVSLGADGPVAFRYYFTDERIILEHVENIADIGEYELTLSYEEDNNGGFRTTDKKTFYILEDKHLLEIKNVLNGLNKDTLPEVYADESGMHFVYYVDCQYIPFEERENIHFEIDKFNMNTWVFEDTTGIINYHFHQKVEWIQYRTDSLKDLIYQAKVTYTVSTYNADLNYSDYYFRAYYGAQFDEFHDFLRATDTYDEDKLDSINDMFKWQINSVTTTATEHQTGDTKKIVNTVDKSQGFVNTATYNSNLYLYNNLYNQSLEVDLTSPRVDVVKWAINDGVGNDVTFNGYSNSFTVSNNTTGTSADTKKLTLYYSNNLYHTVESADETVTTIAAKYGLSASVLASYNSIDVNEALSVGDVLRISPSTSQAMAPGVYRLVIYYENDNYQVVNFTVINNYANVILDSALLNGKPYDKTNNRNMFINTTDTLDIDLTLEGIDASSPYLEVFVTDTNNNTMVHNRPINEYFTGLTVNLQNKVHITKPANNGIPAGEYLLHIKYSRAETASILYTKELIFNLNIGTVYFSYEVGEYVSNPNPLTSGSNGMIVYPVTTNNIPYLFTAPNDVTTASTIFKNNTKVYGIINGNKIDYTSYFSINTSRVNDTQFSIIINYSAGNIPNGIYYIETAYTKDGLTKRYSAEKDNYFLVGSYSKAFNITDTIYGNLTTDEKLHNNLKWDVTYKYEGNNIFPLYMSATVLNNKGQDVSAYFDITKAAGEIKLSYDKNPKIAKGEYTVRLTYFEHSNDVPYVKEMPLTIYGSYKEIVLSDLTKGSSVIYADKNNQYYTFKVKTSVLKPEEISALKAVIYDEEDNVYYSEIDDSIEQHFNVTNTASANGTYTINIVPFKARVGTYKVALYLPNEDYPDEYDESNFLEFTIDDTSYKVNIANTSTISPNAIYNNDPTKAYDKDGVSGDITFTTTYSSISADDVTIGVYDGLTLVKTITPSYTKDGSNYNVTFDTGELTKTGDLDFAICINGLPYSWISKEINKYVPLTELTVTIGNKTYSDNAGIISIPQTTNTSFAINYKPANATDVTFTTSFSDLTKVSIMNNTLIPNETGETELTVANSDISKKFTLRVSSYLSSSVYDVDNENLLILVRHVTSKTISRANFERNLENLTSDRTYTNVSTNTGTNIATGDKLSNGGFTYTIVLFGDINRNGSIDLGDVSRLYGAAIHTRALDSITQMATDINGNKMTDLSDVSRLYRYIIGNSTGY